LAKEEARKRRNEETEKRRREEGMKIPNSKQIPIYNDRNYKQDTYRLPPGNCLFLFVLLRVPSWLKK
jgi:hypothetical protein